MAELLVEDSDWCFRSLGFEVEYDTVLRDSYDD